MAAQRVLIVLASANRRGAEIEGAELAKQLRRRGVDADVVALAGSTNGSALPVEVLGREPLSSSTLRELRRRAKMADVVIAYGSTTLPACAIALLGARTPFIYRSIGDPSRWSRGGLHRLRTALLFHRATKVVALWPDAGEAISHLYRISPKRIAVVPNARDEKRFRPPSAQEHVAARESFGVESGRPVIGVIGALSDEKRPLLAIAAVLEVDGACALIAGDGPLRAEVEAAAVASSGRVKVLGSISDVLPVLHAIDVLLITSRTEGMPGALIEAQLCGVPVVSTDVGAISVMASDEDVVVPAGSTITVIAEAIRVRLGDSPEMKCGQRFTFDRVIDQWLTVLASAR